MASPPGIDDEMYVLAVAMAMNGPHSELPPGMRYSLKDLRHVRWRQLSTNEQRQLLWQAKAAIVQSHSYEPDPEGLGMYKHVGIPKNWGVDSKVGAT
jgi:hypothetical protein